MSDDIDKTFVSKQASEAKAMIFDRSPPDNFIGNLCCRAYRTDASFRSKWPNLHLLGLLWKGRVMMMQSVYGLSSCGPVFWFRVMSKPKGH